MESQEIKKHLNLIVQHHNNSLYFLCDMLDNAESGLDQVQCQNLSNMLSELAYSLVTKTVTAG